MSIKDFYNDMYSKQNNGLVNQPYIYRKLRRFEINRYDIASQLAPGGKSLLDIGCGDGELIFRLKDKYHENWGIDISETRINRINKQIDDEQFIHVRVEDVNDPLDFIDNSFDTITAIAVLEHIFDPYHFISECQRLLKKNGVLIVEVPNIAWLPNRVRLLLGKMPVTSNAQGWDGGHLHYFTVSSLKKLFLTGGFHVVKITSCGIFAKYRRVWGSLLGPDIVIVGHKA